jgi:nucleoside-diphosphate-sugar epimerase
MKTALVCGAGGFIGGHLAKKLKREGYWVRGVDIKEHEFAPTAADEFLLLDLRSRRTARPPSPWLRAHSMKYTNWQPRWAAWASSPPPSARSCETVRFARFQNCYGPEGTWTGGREKAPAALCRKVAEAEDGGTIEVWGDGTAIRSYTYVDDMVDGIYMLMHPDLHGAVNIGCPQYVSVDELAMTIAEVAGKKVDLKHVPGPVGVQSRNFSNERIYSIGWQAKYYLKDGIAQTYPWVEEQVRKAREVERDYRVK